MLTYVQSAPAVVPAVKPTTTCAAASAVVPQPAAKHDIISDNQTKTSTSTQNNLKSLTLNLKTPVERDNASWECSHNNPTVIITTKTRTTPVQSFVNDDDNNDTNNMLAKVTATHSTHNVATIAAAATASGVELDDGAVMVSACDDERARLLDGSRTPPTLPLSLPPLHNPSHLIDVNRVSCGSDNNNSSERAADNDSVSNNNNNINNNNNSISASDAGVTSAAAAADDGDDISEETATAAETSANADSDVSDKQQQQQPFTRQTQATASKKLKLSKLGTKSVGLKRVSFGSSKGSMVETLVFETPTPLSEHVEPTFGFDSTLTDMALAKGGVPVTYSAYPKSNMDDSGIEVQEESERSIVRVSIYQSSQPQQICPPSEYSTRFDDNLDNSLLSSYNCNLDYLMTSATATAGATTAAIMPGYDRQQSTDSGWDNPFRPGGDLSREADEIVNMIRGGKPITPTDDHTIGNGNAQRGSGGDNCNGTATGESVTKVNLTQNQSVAGGGGGVAAAQNGTNSHKSSATGVGGGGGGGGGGGAAAENNGGVTSLAQVSKQVVPGPTSASHVVIDEKKNKKKGCCVVQ